MNKNSCAYLWPSIASDYLFESSIYYMIPLTTDSYMRGSAL